MLNPTYQDVQVGDQYVSSARQFGNCVWCYVSTVLSLGVVEKRFGKDNRVVNVQVTSTTGQVVDETRPMWVSQLRKGG